MSAKLDLFMPGGETFSKCHCDNDFSRIEDLKSLGEKLFPFPDHPWRQLFFQLLEENSGSTFYHATTDDRFEVIYCPAKEKGMWFTRSRAMGPLQARGIEAMKEIVAKR